MISASIPSPSSGALSIGPLELHAYGLCIALGVVAAMWLTSRRWKAIGGSAEDVTAVVTWGVPAGIVGARIYHVLTDFEIYQDDPLQALVIWDGGLGIWGGIAAGVLVGLYVAKRRGVNAIALLDAAAPGIALGQAIGRWGNYFNQELFGKVTDVPWAIEIDQLNRPMATVSSATYHPTFLYESIACLLLCGLLLLLSRKVKLQPGSLFLAYVAGYTFVRFFIEQLRVDFAHTILGVRFNVWVSLVVFVVASVLLFIRERRNRKALTAESSDNSN